MKHVFSFLSILLFLSCTNDSYEKGEGENSLVQADFVEAYTNGDKKVDYVITDDDQRLTLKSLYAADWIQKADSFYRSVLYYEKGDLQVSVVSLAKIPVAIPILKDSLKDELKTDPIKIESLWISKNKKYLNVGFYAKVGATNDAKAAHRLGVVLDTLKKNADNTITAYFQLYHDQGGVPEYYSQKSYFSLPLKGMLVDSVRLSANTYQGVLVKTFSIR